MSAYKVDQPTAHRSRSEPRDGNSRRNEDVSRVKSSERVIVQSHSESNERDSAYSVALNKFSNAKTCGRAANQEENDTINVEVTSTYCHKRQAGR